MPYHLLRHRTALAYTASGRERRQIEELLIEG
jgi:hypothetical protein